MKNRNDRIIEKKYQKHLVSPHVVVNNIFNNRTCHNFGMEVNELIFPLKCNFYF